jgi:tetratricopeptide (TPR) repeat protein
MPASRLWIIFAGVIAAVAVPVLPLGIFGDNNLIPSVGDMVQRGQSWLQQLAPKVSHKVAGSHAEGELPSPAAAPAENLQLLEQAAKELTAQLKKKPFDPALHNKLGLVYLSLGEPNEAIASFHRAVTNARDGIAILNSQVRDYKRQGQTRKAATTLLEASQLNVELSAAHSNLARVYEIRGDHEKVLAELDALNKEGVLFDGGRASQRTIATHRIDPDTAKILAAAESFMGQHRYGEAEVAYRQVLQRDPQVALAHHQLGVLMAVGNNHVQAVDELEAAAKLNPGSAQTHNNLGLTYQALGMSGQAAAAFSRAANLDPRSAEGAINLGNLYARHGQLDDASNAFRYAVAHDPRNPRAHNNLATTLSLQGRNADAISEFQKALSLDPSMASAHYGLGTTFYNMKNYVPAIREFKQAELLNPALIDCRAKIQDSYRRAAQAGG